MLRWMLFVHSHGQIIQNVLHAGVTLLGYSPCMQITHPTHFYVIAAGLLALFSAPAGAASITASVFATGTPISSTSPDSILYGDGSLWVSYQNGADSTGAFGSSTVVRYSLTVIDPQHVDGCRQRGRVEGRPERPDLGDAEQRWKLGAHGNQSGDECDDCLHVWQQLHGQREFTDAGLR